ncbi:MAG: hypothetical protein IJS56_04295 [Bacilli bacterium]|nr:hypothetical protein [Bacilli bacterium]
MEEYYLIPINNTNTLINGERLKDMLYQKFPEIGYLEVTKTSKVLIIDDKDKKEKIEHKSDMKLDKLYEKLNIPKYFICQKHTDGSYTEVETGINVTVKDAKSIEKFRFSFNECYNYWFGSFYDEKIVNFLRKKTELEIQEEKEEIKVKKKKKEQKENYKK